MWHESDEPPKYFVTDDDQDERYPFYPVETGHPLLAMLAVICFAACIFALALL